MTGKRKRIWAILLSILMVLQLSSATVFAETQSGPDVQGPQTESAEEPELKMVPENVTIRFEMDDGTLISKTDMGGKSVKTLGALGVTGGIENAEPEYVTPLHLLAQAMVEGVFR